MANREIYPGGIYPLVGDAVSTAGSSTVSVVSIQGNSVEGGTPTIGDTLIWDGLQFAQSKGNNSCIQINGVNVSDDYEITVNVSPQVLVNGA